MRPLLVEHCYRCHSGKAEKVKAGLLVDRREVLLMGGDSGPVVVPGRPDESRLIEAGSVTPNSLTCRCRPGARLADEQVADLVRWVELGASLAGQRSRAADHVQRADPTWERGGTLGPGSRSAPPSR